MSSGGALEFRVLGPIEVWRGGKRLGVDGDRQRALLALLLLHRNEPVSTDRLVDGLFDGAASNGAVNAVHQLVSRVRRVLEDADRDSAALVTHRDGYVLQVAADGVDAVVFERLLLEGRRLFAAGDAQTASERLTDALELWRGPAFANVPALEAVAAEARRLDELRLLATVERTDAELRIGHHAELVPELESLCQAHPLLERLHEQLALALYRSGRQAEALASYRRASDHLRELGLEPGPALQTLEHRILLHDPTLDHHEPPRAADRPAVTCPFKGLASYERGDAEFFCGRDQLVRDLTARLAQSPLLGVVGRSGIGKSSLLAAGVLASLGAGALPGSAAWRQIMIRPGPHPARTLTSRLDGLAPGECVVLAVDQLEEIFVACQDEAERLAFLDRLVDAVRDPERRIVVVVALRADYYGQIASHAAFARLLSAHHVLVGPMTRYELAQAIELPARRAGLEIEPELVDRLCADLAGQPGALPLLSTMLLELWRIRDGPILRAQTYRLRGGVFGAVARLAEDAFAQLGEDDQRVARRVLLRLASDEDGTLTRRRIAVAELELLPGAKRVLGVLTDARLLTVGDGAIEVSHEALVREWPRYRGWLAEDREGHRVAAHLSASAREWERRGRDPADLYRGPRLAAAQEWVRQHPDDAGPRERAFLDASRAAGERRVRRLRALVAGLFVLLVIAVCAGVIAAVQKGEASKEARVATARQLGAEAVVQPRIDLAMLLAREAVRLDRSPATESTLLATLLRSPAAIASFTLPLGVRPLALALSPDGRTLLADANNDHLYRYAASRGSSGAAVLSGAYADPDPLYSTDGSLLVVADSNAPALDVLDARTLHRRTRLWFDRRWRSAQTVDGFGQSLAIAPDRRTLYYAYSTVRPSGAIGQGYLDRWALPSGHLLSSTRVGAGLAAAIQLIGDARLVVLAGSYARVLNASTLAAERVVALPVALALGSHAAVSPDGTTAAIGNPNGTVSFVDLRTGRPQPAMGGHTAAVQDVSYSPSGKAVVTTGDDGRVMVWDPFTGAALDQLLGHAGRVTGVAFAADGQTLYTAALDGTVLVWDLGSARRFGRLFTIGPPTAPDASGLAPATPPLTVSPDGSSFAVRIDPRHVGIFAVGTLREEESFAVAPGHSITALAWAPTGAQLAVGGEPGLVWLWQVRGPLRQARAFATLRLPNRGPDAVQSLSFDADGGLLAAADAVQPAGTPPSGRVAVWRPATGQVLTGPVSFAAAPNAVALSHDGRLLAVALSDGRVVVLNRAATQRQRTLHLLQGDNGGATSLAFGASGTLLAGDYAGILQEFNAVTGAPVSRAVLAAAAPVASASFDRSGTRIATTGGPGGGLKLWFASTLQQDGATLDPESGTWANAAFTPDGQTLISVSADGSGSAWPIGPTSWAAHACAVAGRNLTHEEWSRFVSGYPYGPVCP